MSKENKRTDTHCSNDAMAKENRRTDTHCSSDAMAKENLVGVALHVLKSPMFTNMSIDLTICRFIPCQGVALDRIIRIPSTD